MFRKINVVRSGPLDEALERFSGSGLLILDWLFHHAVRAPAQRGRPLRDAGAQGHDYTRSLRRSLSPTNGT